MDDRLPSASTPPKPSESDQESPPLDTATKPITSGDSSLDASAPVDHTKRRTRSDSLAIVLACGSAAMALILFLVEKTPLTVGIIVVCIALFFVYPVIHFFPARTTRIPVMIVMVVLVALFGWSVWPRDKKEATVPILTPLAPTPERPVTSPIITQKSDHSTCSNFVVGSSSYTECIAGEKKDAKDKP